MSDTHKTESLHDQIMRLPCTPPKDANINQALSYKSGHRDARHAAAELAAAHEAEEQAAPVAVQDGYRMVPAEPTQEMWAASGDAVVQLTNIGIHHDIVSRVVYDAMLSAAPTPPAGPWKSPCTQPAQQPAGYFVRRSGFGPYVEVAPTEVGAFPLYAAPPARAPELAEQDAVKVPRELLADLISLDHDTRIQAERRLYVLLGGDT